MSRGSASLLIMIGLGLLLSACAGSGEADRPRTVDRTTLTADEIRQANVPGTAYDIVQRLRPAWLQRRSRQPIRVYVDGTPFGATEDSLWQISASTIRHMERLDGLEATGRFGRGHGGGAILVSTN